MPAHAYPTHVIAIVQQNCGVVSQPEAVPVPVPAAQDVVLIFVADDVLQEVVVAETVHVAQAPCRRESECHLLSHGAINVKL